MYLLNKLIWFVINPMNIGIGILVVGIFTLVRSNLRNSTMKWGLRMIALSVVWFIIWCMPITAYVLGRGIECNYREVSAKEAPSGEVALDFGGSFMRAWYAAELVKAGKAKLIIPTAENTMNVDVPLIRDLGIREDQILIEDKARNTEENVKFAKLKYESKYGRGKSPKVLVVSSALHIPRCMIMMRKYWPEAIAIPAPCDFMTTRTMTRNSFWELIRPSLTSYMYAEGFFHEYIGYFGYKWFRK